MGNTAKLMLVGILVMVIVIAVIWDRQSSDLQTAAVVSSRRDQVSGPPPTLASSTGQATGTIHLQQAAEEMQEDPLLEELRREYLGSSRTPAAPVVQAQEAAQEESVQEAASETPEVKTYIVRDGESFWTIARDRYGDATLWEKLWQANIERCPSPELLRAGMTVILPELKNYRILPRPEAITAGNARPNGERNYMVKEGDCLGIISQKFYGTSKKWRLILDANNLEDETSLRAGMKIIIPPDTN